MKKCPFCAEDIQDATRKNPAMTKFAVQFKQFSGGVIRTRDDRKKQ